MPRDTCKAAKSSNYYQNNFIFRAFFTEESSIREAIATLAKPRECTHDLIYWQISFIFM